MSDTVTSDKKETTRQNICPYTGLRAFSADEALYFRGRDLHIEKVVELLEEKKFLMLTGASGDGKSSLVYAGLIPNAKAGFIKAKFNNWVIADFRPEHQPLDNMVAAIVSKLNFGEHAATKTNLGQGYSALADLYKNSNSYVDTESHEWINADEQTRKKLKRNGANLLILVDQFEEFFTNPDNFYKGKVSEDAKIVVNLLVETNKIALEQNLPIYIVCTMRSDYIGHCTSFRGLPELIGWSHYFVPRLNRNEIFQVIDEPAVLSGNKISPRLVTRLLNDRKEGPDVLPILQHTLYQIWKTADEDNAEMMDLIHYAKVGGMHKSELDEEDKNIYDKWFNVLPEYKRKLLASPSFENTLNIHADELYETAHEFCNQHLNGNDPVTTEQAKKIIKATFTCLTKMDDGKAVRNRMSVTEISEVIDDKNIDSKKVIQVLHIFREQGNTLIRPYIANPAGSSFKEWVAMELKDDTVLDITHEALIRNWNRLGAWVAEEYEAAEIFTECQQQLNHWLVNKRSNQYLLSPGQLSYFENWYKLLQPTAPWMQRYSHNGTDVDLHVQDQVPKVQTRKDESAALQKEARKLETDIKDYLSKSQQYIARKRKLAVAALVTISILLVISTVAFFNAQQQKNKAVSAQKIAKSNEIAMKAMTLVNEDPTVAFRLGETAYKIHATNLALQAIMSAYCYPPFYNIFKGRHEGGIVQDIHFSPDGKQIVSVARDDALVKLWNAQGVLLNTFKGHYDEVSSASFSPDGKFILSASDDATAILWDLTGNIAHVFRGHHYRLNAASFARDGKLILTCSDDRTARIWDLSGISDLTKFRNLQENEITIIEHEDKVTSAEFSPDGKTILTTCADNKARLWNLEGGLVRVFQSENFQITEAHFSPGGSEIVTNGRGNDLVLWSINEQKEATLNGQGTRIHSIVFSPDGKYIAAANNERTALLWNISAQYSNKQYLANTGFRDRNDDAVRENPVTLLKHHTAPVKQVLFSPDSRMILTVTDGFTLKLWDLNGTLLQTLRVNDFVETATFSPDGISIIAGFNNGSIREWQIFPMEFPVLKGHTEYVWEADYSPNGEYIATASFDYTARIWSKKGNMLHVLKGHSGKVYYLVFSPDGRYILTSSFDNTARLWNLQGSCLAVLKGHDESLNKSNFSPDGRLIITPSADGTARIWDVQESIRSKKGVVLNILKGHESAIKCAEFSPNGKYILTASADKTARIWDTTGVELRILTGHKARIYRAVFSHNGKYIATASDDGIVKIWSLSGEELSECKGHTSFIVDITFSHNDKYIATVSNDNTARLWDRKGNELQVFKGHINMINTVKFSSKDEYLLTSSDEGTARLWDLNGNTVNIYKGHYGSVQDAKFSPDGKSVLTSSSDGTARIWPLLVKQVLRKINVKKTRGDVWEMTEEDKRAFNIQ